MNPIIKQLAEQAGLEFDDDLVLETEPIYFLTQTDLEKFAELIVLGCVGVVEGGSFLHDQAPVAIFAKACSGAIKRNFGMET